MIYKSLSLRTRFSRVWQSPAICEIISSSQQILTPAAQDDGYLLVWYYQPNKSL